MFERRTFEVDWQYRELKRMLSEAIAGGHVEQIPVAMPNRVSSGEEWYRDKETGEIYSLLEPEERMRGHWEKVDLQDFADASKCVQ